MLKIAEQVHNLALVARAKRIGVLAGSVGVYLSLYIALSPGKGYQNNVSDNAFDCRGTFG